MGAQGLSKLTPFLLIRFQSTDEPLAATHDSVLCKGDLEIDESCPPPAEGAHIKGYKGFIKLNSNVGSSFKAPNLVVMYLIGIRVICPGVNNDVEMLVPIEIVSNLAQISSNGTEMTAPEPDLPPDYFQVTEEGV